MSKKKVGYKKKMADVQLAKGYTPIANKLLEEIYKRPFNATQLKILLLISRYTYGFSRKEYSIAESFISKAINVSKRYVSQELGKLINLNVIKVVKPYLGGDARVLSINKDYEQWLIGNSRTILQQMNDSSIVEQLSNTTDEQLITPTVEQVFNQDKQNIKQNIKQIYSPSKYEDQAEELWKLYPSRTGKSRTIGKIPKLIQQYGLEQLKRTIKRYISDVDTKRKNGFKELSYQNGSTFFSHGYVDYLDENYDEYEELTTNTVKNPLYEKLTSPY